MIISLDYQEIKDNNSKEKDPPLEYCCRSCLTSSRCCVTSSDGPDGSSSSRSGCRSVLIGYTILICVIACYVVAVISIQLVTQKTNTMELNVLRYTTETAIVLGVSLLTHQSLRLDFKVLPYILVIAVAEILYCTCFFFAAAFMPAGNIEGSYTAAFIIFTTLYDLVQKSISKLSFSSALVSCLGLLLLLQLWKQNSRQLITVAPCDFLDGNLDYYENYEITYYNNNTLLASNYTYNQQTVESSPTVSEYSGYLLAACGALGSAVAGYAYQRALVSTSMQSEALLFWSFLIETIVSLLLTVAWNSYHGDGYGLPTGTYCLLFTLLFTTTSGVGCVLNFWAYRYIAVSALALAWPLVTVVLYVSQRTFLHKYHPGQSNTTEVAGIVFINMGALLSAIINILYQSNKLKF